MLGGQEVTILAFRHCIKSIRSASVVARVIICKYFTVLTRDIIMSNPGTESGFLDKPTPGVSPLNFPPNLERFALEQFKTFSATYSQHSRSYRYTVDEAIRHSYEIALAIFRDPLVYACMRARQLPTAQYPWHLEPHDEGDMAQLGQIKTLTKIINDIPNFYQFRLSLLESIFFGKAACQYRMKWSQGNRKGFLGIVEHKPINGDKIVFQWDGSIGIRVSSAMYKGSRVSTDLSTVHFLSPVEREVVTVCKFEPTDVDYFDGEMAGAINGFGLRGRIFLYWFIRQNILSLLYSYLERVAAGFTIFYYQGGNPTSFEQVHAAASTQIGQNSILFPRMPGDDNTPSVQRLEAGTAGPAIFSSQVERMDSLIQFVILGQNLTFDTAPTGLGSGVAGAHERTFDRYLRADALMLQESINTDLLQVLNKYNFPDLPCPKFVIDIDKPNVTEIVAAAQTLYQMGAPVDGDYLQSVIGLPRPEPGANILSMPQMMSPMAMTSTPQGVPGVGPEQTAGNPDVSDAEVDAYQKNMPPGVIGVPGQYSRQAIRNIIRYNRQLRQKGILHDAYRYLADMKRMNPPGTA